MKLYKSNKIIIYKLKKLYSLTEAKNKLVSRHKIQNEKQLIKELADIILIENIIVDEDIIF